MKLPMIRAVFVFSALLAVALLVSGCAGSRSLSQDEQQSLAEAATAAPKLQPGDKIRVTVFGEDKLSGEYELDQSGQISLPLAGTVQALGLTQAELEHALAKKFQSQYLKNPKVTVTIANAPAVLRDGRGYRTRRISLQEWPQRAHRNGRRWWSNISSKPYHRSDPTAGRDRFARISHIGIGPNLTW
jgi:hypothetical protein